MKLEVHIKKLAEGAVLQFGCLEGFTCSGGTSTPMVAAVQEFGAPGAVIPPRPFFRNMVKAKGGGWAENLASLLKATNYDAVNPLRLRHSFLRPSRGDAFYHKSFIRHPA